MRDQRAEALAQILVRYSTGVRKGDVCVIQATTTAEREPVLQPRSLHPLRQRLSHCHARASRRLLFLDPRHGTPAGIAAAGRFSGSARQSARASAGPSRNA